MSMRSTDSPVYSGQRVAYDDVSTEGSDSISILDRFSNFDGTFHSSRDLRIEGQAKGTIECQGTLHIAQGASIDAKVEAENITVAGDLDGQITCRGRLQILPSGRVRGTITTQTLVIHDGAFYEGQLQMSTPDRQLGSGRRARSAGAPVAPAAFESPRTDETRSESGPAGGSTFIRRFGGQETNWETTTPATESTDDDSQDATH
ncbi:MAG: polymer-forming cytoskeletal protein [Thermomicrobiales bacterium]